jgi:hypothetical protein
MRNLRNILAVMASASALLLMSAQSRAQVGAPYISSPAFTVDVFENGSVLVDGQAAQITTNVGPDGVPVYALSTGFINVGSGDIAYQEAATGPVSDLIRIYNAGNGVGGTFSVFSDISPTDPADDVIDYGIPGPNPANGPTVSQFPEDQAYVAFGTINGLPGSWTFHSDVPEPTALSLLGSGVALVLRRRRR